MVGRCVWGLGVLLLVSGPLSRAPMETQSLGVAQSEDNLVWEPNILLVL